MVRKALLVASLATVAVFSSQCGSGGSGGTGGGSSGTGGTSGTGGGTAGTGGGTHTGGGTAGTGGGTAGTGGGTHTGGGTAGTGGGTAGTGGGTAGTGGGTANTSCDPTMADTCATGTECLISSETNTSMAECFPGACNLVTQDCGNGMEVYNYVQGANGPVRGCQPAGSVAVGGLCGTSGDGGTCVPGAVCAGMTGSPSTCSKFCEIGGAACPGGTACNTIIGFQGATEFPLICATVTAACDVLAQNCPTSTNSCLPTGGGGSQCVPAGTTAVNATCDTSVMTSDVCVKGSVCLGSGTGTSGNCIAFCNNDGGMPSCAAGTCMDLQVGGGVGGCNPN